MIRTVALLVVAAKFLPGQKTVYPAGRLRIWQHALNNDLRWTPTGGEDSISNMHVSRPLGSP